MADDLQFKVGVDADLTGLTQTEAALTDVASAAKSAAKETALFSDEQKKAAQELADSLPPLKNVKKEADDLGKTLGGTKSAVTGLGNVLGGIFTGNIVQAGKGLLDLGKAAQSASGAMQAFLGSVARGASIGAALAAPFLIAIGLMKKFAAIYDEQMQAIWANQGQSTKRLAELQEAEAQRVVEAQERVAQSYRNTTAAINEQTRVASALAAEKTKQALLGANTPEERQRIEDAAAIAGVDSEIETADRLMREADAAGDVDAFNAARGNKAIALEKRNTATKAQQKNVSAFAKAGATTRSGLAAQASQQQATGDFAGQAATVAEIKKLDAELRKNSAAVAGALGGVTKTVEKNTAKVNATKEAGGGH